MAESETNVNVYLYKKGIKIHNTNGVTLLMGCMGRTRGGRFMWRIIGLIAKWDSLSTRTHAAINNWSFDRARPQNGRLILTSGGRYLKKPPGFEREITRERSGPMRICFQFASRENCVYSSLNSGNHFLDLFTFLFGRKNKMHNTQWRAGGEYIG